MATINVINSFNFSMQMEVEHLHVSYYEPWLDAKYFLYKQSLSRSASILVLNQGALKALHKWPILIWMLKVLIIIYRIPLRLWTWRNYELHFKQSWNALVISYGGKIPCASKRHAVKTLVCIAETRLDQYQSSIMLENYRNCNKLTQCA